jgi:hypothetical protein
MSKIEIGRGGVKASKRILLYGNSVVLGTIGASLNCFSEYEVVTLKLPQKESIWLGPAIIGILIFDSQRTQPEEVMCFLRANSALLLIGIDPDVNQVQLWSGRQIRELSTQGLLKLINDQEAGGEV